MNQNHKIAPILFILLPFGYLNAQWISTLPQEVQNAIQWVADHEEGTLMDWTLDNWQYAGGGILADDVSQPIWTLNVDHNDVTQAMSLYLYSKYNAPHSYGQSDADLTIPVDQWVHIEAFYKASTGNVPNGEIKIWQDGILILEASNVITTLEGEEVIWGIGNYTDHIDGGAAPGTANLYFDDCIVSTKPIHPHLNEVVSSTEGITIVNTGVYPNPASTFLHFNFKPKNPLRLFNAIGRKQPMVVLEEGIDISGMASGLYFLLHGKKLFPFIKQ